MPNKGTDFLYMRSKITFTYSLEIFRYDKMLLTYLHGQPSGTIKSISDCNALLVGSFSITSLAKSLPKESFKLQQKMVQPTLSQLKRSVQFRRRVIVNLCQKQKGTYSENGIDVIL